MGRIIYPNFVCPKCGNKLSPCKTEENGVWGLSECSQCEYFIDAHDLIKKGGKIIEI